MSAVVAIMLLHTYIHMYCSAVSINAVTYIHMYCSAVSINAVTYIHMYCSAVSINAVTYICTTAVLYQSMLRFVTVG